MNKKLSICLICFWFSFLAVYCLFPNTICFKYAQALFQDKVVVTGMTISIIDDIEPSSEITNITKLDKKSIRIDYQASDVGRGIDRVELWQRDLISDWCLVKENPPETSSFIIENLPDSVYHWVTTAVDKAGNRQTETPELLAQERFNNWQFSIEQIDATPPSIAFSIPGFQTGNPILEEFEINGSGTRGLNVDIDENNYLVFNYSLTSQAMSELVSVQVSINNQMIFTDGAGEQSGWVGDSDWRQVTYPLKDRQGEIEILFRLINNDVNNYQPALQVKNIGIVSDKAQFEGNKIMFIAHDLGSGIKEATQDNEITVDKLETKLFTATDFNLNTTTFEPNY